VSSAAGNAVRRLLLNPLRPPGRAPAFGLRRVRRGACVALGFLAACGLDRRTGGGEGEGASDMGSTGGSEAATSSADAGSFTGTGNGTTTAGGSGSGSATSTSGMMPSGTVTATTDDAGSASEGATTGAPDPCDRYTQDCPSGSKCAPASASGGTWNTSRCVAVSGDGQAGEACTVTGAPGSGEDTCALGLLCWDPLGAGEGECVPLCTWPAGAAGPGCDPFPGTSCTIASDGTLELCLPNCDPRELACAPGLVCVDVGAAGFLCIPDASGAMGAAGDGCAFVNACDAGLVCLAPDLVPGCTDAPGCCAPVCDVTLGDGPCPAGTTCQPYDPSGAAPVGLETLGVCISPP
jgi:hypothetical protein